MIEKQYIAKSTLFPEWFVTLHEQMTVIGSLGLVIILIMLVNLFVNYSSKLDKLLTKAFLADLFRAGITLLMGLGLYFDWADGVKIVVILRPYVLFFACYAMYLLYEHYKKLFKLGFNV